MSPIPEIEKLSGSHTSGNWQRTALRWFVVATLLTSTLCLWIEVARWQDQPERDKKLDDRFNAMAQSQIAMLNGQQALGGKVEDMGKKVDDSLKQFQQGSEAINKQGQDRIKENAAITQQNKKLVEQAVGVSTKFDNQYTDLLSKWSNTTGAVIGQLTNILGELQSHTGQIAQAVENTQVTKELTAETHARIKQKILTPEDAAKVKSQEQSVDRKIQLWNKRHAKQQLPTPRPKVWGIF